MNQIANTRTRADGNAKFRPPSVDKVRVTGFFGPRIDTICADTAKILLDRCIEARMLEQVDPNLPNPGIVIPFTHNNTVTPQMFWDSDFGKSIEAGAYALAHKPDPELEARLDEIIDAYGRLQQDDGYLNSWYIRIQPGERWTNLRDRHEMYNAGHLIEGAVAYFHATGKRKLLDIMAHFADHIDATFGSDAGKLRGYPGHPELELALVKLGRATGEKRYLDLAKFFVDERGQTPSYFDQEAQRRGEEPEDFFFGTLEYCQAHAPVRAQDKVVGHAVRAAYLYAGMADVATEYSDEGLTKTLDTLWSHLVDRNLYLTGGFGPSAANEGLTFDYDLPNETAYAETCASVALVFWASRMLGRGPDARYGDIMEQALYNNALAGLSLDGKQFFYDNPLESRGGHHRWTWHRCPCCPPNISRLVASVGSYLFSVATDEIAVHLYNSCSAELEVAGGTVKLHQDTDYPASGDVRIVIDAAPEQAFALSLRVPGWAKDAKVKINGRAAEADILNGYIRLTRTWATGDEVALSLDLSPRRVFAHGSVTFDQGRTALMYGPLVMCLEEVDNGPDLNSLILRDNVPLHAEAKGPLDLPSLVASGIRERTSPQSLYVTDAPEREETTLTAIPYFAWDNRAPGAMLTWIRREPGE